MKSLLYTICFNLLLAGIFYPQETGKDVKHDQITGLIADVLFDSRAKPVRQALTAFEIKNGIKLQFRVEDSSLDQLGGLSEHLFRLFQNFTTLQNTNVKTITGQFGVQEKDRPAPVLAYNSKVTPDLSPCILPREDTGRMDSLYNRFLSGAPMGDIENIEMMPSGLDGIYGDAAYHYAKILHKNVNCPGIFDANLYNQHVNATRQNRASKWAGDIAAISVNLSAYYSQLTTGQANTTGNNSGNTDINLNIHPNNFSGQHIINLNNSVNSCTKEDLEVSCRMLYKKTGIRFLFLTQSLDYFIPQDSLSVFKDAATATFSTNLTDDIIIALYLKMEDQSASKSSGIVLVKQQNGTWLTNAEIDFANYNNVGDNYKASTLYRFRNLMKNIPKPLILCYQVAKVNGLLTTSYIQKAQAVKGREQIYYHIFKIDKALPQIKELDGQLRSYIAQASQQDYVNPITKKLILETEEKIKVAYIRATRNPEFDDAGFSFKELYLQDPEQTKVAALDQLQQNYGQLYKNNDFDNLIGNYIMPTDLMAGSCKINEETDPVGDLLGVASLLLMPTGLDFLTDALSVVYFGATDQYKECLLGLGSIAVPGNLNVAKKAITSTADAVNAINKGDLLLKENGALKLLSQDANHMMAVFKIKPQDMAQPLLNKISNQPAAVKDLLTTDLFQAKIYSNVTEHLDETKRLEFVNKYLDDAGFRAKVLNDPDEVLRWGGEQFEGFNTSIKIKNINSKTHFDLESEYLSKFPGSPNYPYLKSAPVEEITLAEKTYFVRVHNDGNMNREWIMSIEDFNNLKKRDGTIAGLVDELALPSQPSKISLVEVPANETVRKSVAGPQSWTNGPQNQAGGFTQYQIMGYSANIPIPSNWFTKTIDILDVLK